MAKPKKRKRQLELAVQDPRPVPAADAPTRVEDAPTVRRPVAGRPSLTAAGTVSPLVSFRVSSGLREAALRRAAAEGRTVSDVARDALERYLRR